MVRITRESWSRKLMMEIRRRRGSSALQRLRVSRKDNQVGGGSFSPSLLRHLPQIQDTNPDMPMCAPPTLYPSPGCRLRPRLHPTVPGSNPLWRGLCVSSRAPLPGDRACHLLPPRRPPPAPSRTYMSRTLPLTVSCFSTAPLWGSASGARDPQAISASKRDGKGTQRALEKIRLRHHPNDFVPAPPFSGPPD